MNTTHDVEIGGFQVSGGNAGGRLDRPQAQLTEEGREWADIRADLLARKGEDYVWRTGRIPIYIYHDNDELLSVSREAYNLYFVENALGSRAFPSLARMEDEVIRMSLSLFCAPESASGSFTSGGTESIFLVFKAARDRFRAAHTRNLRPHVIVPRTAHPEFDKAAHYLDIDVIRIAIGSDLRADVAATQAAVNGSTMMIVGSAPCYPYGVFDPIVQLGEVALERGIWLHVDACLGGFLAPFARDVGYPIPPFDFSIPGVSSLSADLHKHGFSAKGASVILYRSAALHAYQGFNFNDWPRGSYSTETFLGTRPGGPIASAWAVSQYLGQAGYRRLASRTMNATKRLISGIATIAGLEVLHPSELSIVLYKSVDPSVDIDAVAELLGERGWFVGRSREPRGIHLALNPVHAPVVDDYLSDLETAVHQVRLSGRVGVLRDVTY